MFEASEKSKSTKLKKFYTIICTLLILLIPILFLYGIVEDRSNYERDAERKVETSWASSQTITAPRLAMPTNDTKNPYKCFTLNDYDIDVYITTELRKKGIFKVPVYTANVEVKGNFKNDYAPLKNQPVEFSFNVSDSKGFVSSPQFKLMDDEFVPSHDTIYKKKLTTSAKLIPFEITYKLRGSKEIYVKPEGLMNKIEIEGDWHNPSFEGDFLPAEREVAADYFEGEWEIPYIAVSSQKDARLGVSLLMPVDTYRMATRALKYSFLFLSLTFLSYFIFEITSKENKRIHPLQYMMMGAAMLIFYLLLVSMSEFIPFGAAYLIAGIMTVALIGAYTYFILTKRQNLKFALLISAIMTVLYVFFYTLLVIQDFSLIIGSFVLFLIISLVMYTTRNVEWYND